VRKYAEGSLDRGPNRFAGFFQQVLTQTTERCLSGKQHWIMLRPPSNFQFLIHRPQKVNPEAQTVWIIKTGKCQLYICLVFKDTTMFDAHILRYFLNICLVFKDTTMFDAHILRYFLRLDIK